MNRIRRLAAVQAGLAGALLAFAPAAPAALASPLRPDPPWLFKHPSPGHVVHTAAFGGMPGWQITLIAATALAAPAVAVLWNRAPAARKPVTGAAAALHAPRSSRWPPGRPLQGRNTHPKEPLMDSRLMFRDCPAYLDRDGGERCGLPAEVRCRFIIRSAGGPLDSAMIRCPAGHWFNGPIESLTTATEPARGAGLLRRAPKTGGSYHDPLFERPDLVEHDYYRFRHQPYGW